MYFSEKSLTESSNLCYNRKMQKYTIEEHSNHVSISDIKQEAYPAAYRRGKELYERGLVQEFSYDVYTEDGVPKAELIGRVKGTVEDHYDVRLVIDEEYAEVSESRCNCEAFCNYEGICKHCVAVALAYVNRRQAKDILNAKLGVSEKTEQKDIRTEKS